MPTDSDMIRASRTLDTLRDRLDQIKHRQAALITHACLATAASARANRRASTLRPGSAPLAPQTRTADRDRPTDGDVLEQVGTRTSFNLGKP